jgi:phospholipid/cholesterol/gamma-HCH transport system substrate-binding protein
MNARATEWRDVRIGAAAVAVGAVLLFLLWVGRGRNPFAEAYTLVFYVDNAKGLQEGAPVWLSGLRVGEVRQLDVLAPGGAGVEGAPRMNIAVHLEIAERYRTEITDHSLARIAPRGISGARDVRIEKGPVGGSPLENGERIATAPSLDVEALLDRAARVVSAVEAFNREAKAVGDKVEAGGGSLGRFLADPADNEASEGFEEMNARAASVLRSIDEGAGTLPLERREGGIRSSVAALRESLDRFRAAARGGSLAAATGDDALALSLERLTDRLDRLERRMASGRGSLARFLNDPELYARLDSVAVALDSLAAQVAEDPLGSVNVDLR